MMAALRHLFTAVAGCTVAALGTGTGIALASSCDWQYCNSELEGTCVYIGLTQPFSCCKDFDNDNIKHCVSCLRDAYNCDGQLAWSGAYGCNNPGEVCS
jgi:hypothetical protein